MKKFLKNAMLIMLVSFFILNIINLVWQNTNHNKIVIEIAQTVQKINNGETIVENAYQTIYEMFASTYYMTVVRNFEIQTGIIIVSIVLGITIGMIITFEEKSKIRVIIIYILGLLLTALCYTICAMDFDSFFKELLYHLADKWKLYTLAFFITYTIKIYINNRKTRELNKVLNEKQKRIDLEK